LEGVNIGAFSKGRDGWIEGGWVEGVQNCKKDQSDRKAADGHRQQHTQRRTFVAISW